ncbi:MAG: histidine phosphatase family protein [Propionibacteriaceae bacterium]
MALVNGGGERDGRRTVVHLVRHGEVENPTGVLYGRLPDFHLSVLGRAMAERLGEYFAPLHEQGRITHLRCSPLERAQETMDPIQTLIGLPVVTDGRVIEADNRLEGQRVGLNRAALRNPRNWVLFRNPFTPSWGEPYVQIAARMRAAIADAAAAAADAATDGSGGEAVIVSHQLPIWVSRLAAEGRRFWHDPRRRECTLASVTSFTLIERRVSAVTYTEPARDLLPQRLAQGFVAGA